jgi:hypothetical protein
MARPSLKVRIWALWPVSAFPGQVRPAPEAPPPEPGVRQKCRANAFPLVAALFLVVRLQSDGNMQVSAVRAGGTVAEHVPEVQTHNQAGAT